ncbi:MAG TPA: hypothetical protein VMS14_06210 [Ilumatobacteraceae bacterium]|nr:hypothetical protein [Ilumatobacteraceae bacterium]
MAEGLRFAQLAGWRIIAEPVALDDASWPAGAEVVRISPDDAFVVSPTREGSTSPTVPGDPFAIVTPEHGFAGAFVDAGHLELLALHHIEWQLPEQRPALAQGQIAGVPAKLVLHADGSALLLVACAARRELEERLEGGQ